MKIIFFLSSLICLQNCNNSSIKYYQGYVYSLKKEPLENIFVYEMFDSINMGKTNKEGFFKIKKNPNSISQFLIIKDKNRIIDSIQIIRTHPERGEKYYFVEGRKDTLFVDLK